VRREAGEATRDVAAARRAVRDRAARGRAGDVAVRAVRAVDLTARGLTTFDVAVFAWRAAHVAGRAGLALNVTLEATWLAVMRAGVACTADAVVTFADGGACIAGVKQKREQRYGEDGDGLHVPMIRCEPADSRYQPDLSACRAR